MEMVLIATAQPPCPTLCLVTLSRALFPVFCLIGPNGLLHLVVLLVEFNTVASTSKLVIAISSKPLLTVVASAKSLRINSTATLGLARTPVSLLLGVSGVILQQLAEPRTRVASDIS